MIQEAITHLKQIQAESGEFTLYRGNIIRFQPSEIASRDVEKTADGVFIFNELCQEGLAGVVVDLRNLKKGVTKEVRDYTAQQLHGRLYGSAILVDSSLSRIIGNIMLNFLPQGPHRRKIFNSLEDAISWLDRERAESQAT